MIGYVRGAVTHLFTDYCFIDVQGVGYRIFIAGSTRQKLVLGTVASLFTYLQVREDALLLYGFYTQDEYELFLQLLSVTGIGPKVALGVLSAISPNDFRRAISQKNMIILTKLPGIGKKTAERLILELKDKIGIITESEGTDDFVSDETSIASEVTAQGLQALLSLGYSQSEIGPVLQKIGNTQTVEELIKLALKEFSRR